MTSIHAPALATDTTLAAPGRAALWERAVFTLICSTAAIPLITCLTVGRAGWSALALLAEPFLLVGYLAARDRARRTDER